MVALSASQLDLGAGATLGAVELVGSQRPFLLGGPGVAVRAELGDDVRFASVAMMALPMVGLIPGESPGFLGSPTAGIPFMYAGIGFAATVFTSSELGIRISAGSLAAVGATPETCGDCYGQVPTWTLVPTLTVEHQVLSWLSVKSSAQVQLGVHSALTSDNPFGALYVTVEPTLTLFRPEPVPLSRASENRTAAPPRTPTTSQGPPMQARNEPHTDLPD
jgi:hypothetical protein